MFRGSGKYPLVLLARGDGGARSWIWPFVYAGKTYRRTYGSPDRDRIGDCLGMSAAEAQRNRDADASILGEGKDPRVVRPLETKNPAAPQKLAEMTVSRLLRRYAKYHLLNGRKRVGDENVPLRRTHTLKVWRRLRKVREAWGARLAKTITRENVTALLDDFEKTPAMQEMMQVHIAALFSFAESRGHIDRNPCKGMKKRGGSNSRKRWLAQDELALVLPKLWEMHKASRIGASALLVCLLTGRRKLEVLRAEWREFERDDNGNFASWTLPGAPEERLYPSHSEGNGVAKNGIAHTLPISPLMRTILDDLWSRRIGEGRFVFHREGEDEPITEVRPEQKDARAAGASIMAKSKSPKQAVPWTVHDLRRTASSTLEELLGLDESSGLIKSFLNHDRDIGVTNAYMRGDKAPLLKAAMNKLSAHYEAILARPC
jgi:integrase